MPPITYRAATLADLPTLALLRWEMQVDWRERPEEFAATREPYIATYCDAMREELHAGRMHAWLAESAGAPLAAVTLLTWLVPPSLEEPRRLRGQVSNVYTRPAYRRQGISRALMTLLLEWAQAHQVLRLLLWASDMGRPLYTSLGFEESDAMELRP
ncbi:MAG TPA: GNAT family N-acetyltransferase [Ktedonobacterales bacterium]|nr:GNAT family N-acetyltransferase [Ktedonobacterales bacterium]